MPNAVLTRWLTLIRLFGFDIRHISGASNGMVDGISRPEWAAYAEYLEEYQDEMIDGEFGRDIGTEMRKLDFNVHDLMESNGRMKNAAVANDVKNEEVHSAKKGRFARNGGIMKEEIGERGLAGRNSEDLKSQEQKED
ncbi:hypothetical protein V1522DRAFT_395423 [Lipomyces starkeyi]